ncbi:substrate-binding and VWA domain-containing protein [Nocardia gipuzkoensis]|uniref:VWA domain-containing protein n=1 Tax=Nocardia gipuzkoensis TaxID=2749991 RepID=UPI001E572FCD|nr:VWA domain-containing protein [Nocardia gipuzkoensis]UGT68479.1 substrate-binding and VWA domain-containing protein [Nocardia gipuzkoensis]
MGTHRSGTRSRGVSKGPVIAVVAVVLLAAIVVGWFQLRDRAANQDSAAAAECVEGPATLYVTADPSIAAQVRTAADSYNATQPKVRDHCARVAVNAQPSSAIVAAFTSGKPWDQALGPQPALWIADSTRSIESMRVPGLIEGTPVSIAASPIVLAVPEELHRALEQAEVSWADLPRLQQGSLGEIGLSGWGGLRMALPSGDATLAAATAVGSAVSGAEPLTEQAARSGQVVAAISGLAADAPESSGAAAALAEITTQDAPMHAIAATEQQLKGLPGVLGFRPAGAAPVADYPAALMSGAWVDKTQNLIAGRFTDYLRKPEQAQAFVTAGFGGAPQTAAAVPSRGALDKVRDTLAHPVLGVRSTVLVDVSASMGTAEGATTRLANVLAALNSTMTVMPPDFGLGVWTFGKNLDGNTPYRVAAATAPLTTDQRTKISTALSSVRPDENRSDQAYPSLIAAYKSAVTGYTSGRTNSVLLITDGPDDDSTVTGPQLAADITAAIDRTRPVRVDVIVLGGSGTQTLQALAQQTGGNYTRLATSDDIRFGSALVKALTTP